MFSLHNCAFSVRVLQNYLILASALLFPILGACSGKAETIQAKEQRLPSTCEDGRIPEKDPLYERQWHLNSTGQDGAKSGADVNIEAAWNTGCLGQEIIIAVVDDGVQTDHEDFKKMRVLPFSDYVDADSDPSPNLNAGDFHGTSVAGVAAAAGNGKGVMGAAPEATVMPLRLVGETIADTDAMKAFVNAANNGAHIINNSWGPPDGDPFTDDDEQEAFIEDDFSELISDIVTTGRDGRGVIITWAAGNGNEPVELDPYASHPDVIAVGAVDDQLQRSYYSDYGPAVFISAPSNGGSTSGIVTTDVTESGYNLGSLGGGVYTIEVYPYENSGSYTLTLGGSGGSTVNEVESNDNTPQVLNGYPLVVDGAISTAPSSAGEEDGDTDNYQVTVPDGGSLLVHLDVPDGADFDLAIYKDGIQVVVSEEYGSDDESYTGSASNLRDAYTDDFGGTSSACPLVSGVIALAMSRDPNLTLPQTRWILKNAARRDILDDTFYPFTDGYSEGFGYGMVDAAKVVELAGKPQELNWSPRSGAAKIIGKRESAYREKWNARLRRNLGTESELYYRFNGRRVNLAEVAPGEVPVAHRNLKDIQQGLENGNLKAVTVKGTRPVRYAAGKILVRLGNLFSAAAREKLWERFSVRETEQLYKDYFLVEPLNPGAKAAQTALAIIHEMLESGEIESARPQFRQPVRRR